MVQVAPQYFVPTQDNIATWNDEFANPQDSDVVLREVVNKDPSTRAKVITEAWQNKHVSTKEEDSLITTAPQEFPSSFDSLSSITSMIPDIGTINSPIIQPPGSSLSNIDQLHKKLMTHSEEWH